MGFWPVVLNVLRNSDVVLLIVDARMPSVARNSEILAKTEKMGKRLVLVFNKVDLVSKERLEEIKNEPQIHTDLHRFFVSATKNIGIRTLRKSLEEMSEGHGRASLRVGVVGYPNAGKSALINALTGSELKVRGVSGTTKKTAWLRLGRLRVMDSPGVIPAGDDKVALGLTASKDPHKIKNVDRVALSLLKVRSWEFGVGRGVRKFYGVSDELDDYEALLEVGRKKGFLVKGGKVDEYRTSIRIVEDWQKGRISV